MHIGMLWFSGIDNKQPLKAQIEKAVDYYRRKYHQEPNLCLVHPDMLESKADAGLTCIGALKIRAFRPVLPGHLWIGIEEAKA
jgi:hypothetical protein